MKYTYIIDKLSKDDYHKGFLQLLEQLTEVNSKDISYDDFCKQFDRMNSTTYVIRVSDKVVATGSLFIENKFIHKLSSVGHIEDIVVDKDYSGNGFGSIMVDVLKRLAKGAFCYKVILDCDKDVVGFYEKCGFVVKGVEMAMYF